ncbi:MAG: DUF899 family protein [Acidobacteriota bacterium]
MMEHSSSDEASIRAEIARLENEVLAARQRLADARRRAPAEPFEDYELATTNGPVRLSDLFGDRRDLLVVHNMGRACSYCTLWADGFDGIVDHLESRAAFAVVSPDSPTVQQDFAASRGWRFRMASSEGSSFAEACGAVDENGGPMPAVSAFRRRDDGTIERVARAEVEPYDPFCSAWYLFELLDDGVAGWEPKTRYEGSRISRASG